MKEIQTNRTQNLNYIGYQTNRQKIKTVYG